ncbi:MAG: alkaline phosphatase [Sedimentisphaerales bacterium]|nr:alkaline phosphatase [Sedimentisphaerales bacterium]
MNAENNRSGTKHAPKNIIIMISDGCGYNHVDATSLYEYGMTGMQVYEDFPVQLAMSTYMYGGSYDPEVAWTDFDYVNHGKTDSAAAATAMSAGLKTRSGYIGMDASKNWIEHLVEVCEDLGMSTGVITSVQWSHATPAGFSAHNSSRSNYAEIAREMINESRLDVIMGCGHPFYNNDGIRSDTVINSEYTGGKGFWSELVNNKAGGDADGDGIADIWRVIQTREDFLELMTGETPKRVLGTARVAKTLQQDRSGDKKAAPYSVDFIETVPTLAEMTRGALNVLDNDPKGFFLMVEGGAVDWASHANQSGRMIEEEMDFNRSVEAVVTWIRKNSNWGETLVIVTGDHECGYLTGPGSGETSEGPVWNALVNKGMGEVPGMRWNSSDHTNSLIPFYAKGRGARLFKKEVLLNDPVRGETIDNTDIAVVIRRLLKADLESPQGIGLEDFAYVAGRWLMDDCGHTDGCDGADLDGSGTVDAGDLMFLKENWLSY